MDFELTENRRLLRDPVPRFVPICDGYSAMHRMVAARTLMDTRR